MSVTHTGPVRFTLLFCKGDYRYVNIDVYDYRNTYHEDNKDGNAVYRPIALCD